MNVCVYVHVGVYARAWYQYQYKKPSFNVLEQYFDRFILFFLHEHVLCDEYVYGKINVIFKDNSNRKYKIAVSFEQ